MHRAFRHWLLLSLFLLGGAFLVAACQTSLSTNLDGKQCDPSRRCAAGYVCEQSSNLCVHAVQSCRDGETICGSRCVVLSTDAANCGGCDATCTAPLHGVPVCTASRCNFACDEGYAPCGTVCVDLSSDADNCGSCGTACPDQTGGIPSCKAGVCGVSCEAPLQDCDGACVDILSDP